jgi:ABC-type methionine transport system ATPase subunit
MKKLSDEKFTSMSNDPYTRVYYDAALDSKLKVFMDRELTSTEHDFPPRLKKLILIVKACLERPKILLIDQKALNINLFSFKEIFHTITNVLPNCSILMIMSTFEDILVTDRTYVMEKGSISEHGKTKKLILDRESKLSQTMIKSDKKDWDTLYKEVGGPARDNRIIVEQDMLAKQRRNQLAFAIDKTDLQFGEGDEVSEQNVGSKLFEVHHSHLMAAGLDPSKLDLDADKIFESLKEDPGEK